MSNNRVLLPPTGDDACNCSVDGYNGENPILAEDGMHSNIGENLVAFAPYKYDQQNDLEYRLIKARQAVAEEAAAGRNGARKKEAFQFICDHVRAHEEVSAHFSALILEGDLSSDVETELLARIVATVGAREIPRISLGLELAAALAPRGSELERMAVDLWQRAFEGLLRQSFQQAHNYIGAVHRKLMLPEGRASLSPTLSVFGREIPTYGLWRERVACLVDRAAQEKKYGGEPRNLGGSAAANVIPFP